MTTPTVVRYEPRGAARELFRARDPELCIVGAAGTGKSLACLYRMHLVALNNPAMRGLIVRKTAVSLTSTTLVTFKKKVVKEALATGLCRWYGGSAEQAAGYYYDSGAVINVGGMDKPEKIMSSEYDLVFCDEATELTVDDWEAIGTRLRNGGLAWQQQIAAANPSHPGHWLKARADEGKMRMLTSIHRDNPRFVNADGTLTPEGVGYMAKLDNLTGVRRLRLRDGKWAAAEGLVYEDFDPTVHVVDLAVIKPEWRRTWVIDFGYTNPFCWQDWAEDEDGRLYLVREIYATKGLVEDHARTILGIVAPGGKWIEPKPRAIVCDHDAEDRATLQRHLGMGTIAAHKTVKDGIQAVQARLRPAGDGKPRIFFCQNATVSRDPELIEAKKPAATVEEIVGYIWDAQPGKQPKEAPVKADDHGCLIAGTLVATPAGNKPIEQIGPGDLVLTRLGPRPVIASGMTSLSAAVYRVELSSGASLVGTGNHPVWVAGEGWKRLDSLRYADRLIACQTLSQSGSMASSSAATLTRPIGQTASTTPQALPIGSAVLADSTKRSGSRRTAQYRTAARSTTPTTTPATTTWPTLSASPSHSTRTPTGNEDASDPGPRSSKPTSTGYAPSLSTGTAARKDEPGTGSTPSTRDSESAWHVPTPANSADRATRAQAPTITIDSAPTPARPPGAGQVASTTSNAPAPTAVGHSPSTGTAAHSAAAVHVLSVCALPEPQAVFNLTVADQPEYFAQGILVHNCDAMRYAVAEHDLRSRPRVRWLG